MKNIFVLLMLFTWVAGAVHAQGTLPRTGNRPSHDNTYRTLTYAYDSVIDRTGNDTMVLKPSAFHTQLYCWLVDSITISIPSLKTSYRGDELELQVFNLVGGGHAVKWGANIVTTTSVTIGSQAGAMYVASGRRASIFFHFDGTKWVEISRAVEP